MKSCESKPGRQNESEGPVTTWRRKALLAGSQDEAELLLRAFPQHPAHPA